MKSIVTLFGWLALGASIAFGGNYAWNAYKGNKPGQAKHVSTVAKKAMDLGTAAAEKVVHNVQQAVETKTVESQKENSDAPVSEPGASSRENSVADRLYKIADNASIPAEKDELVAEESSDAYAERQNQLRLREDALIARHVNVIDELEQ